MANQNRTYERTLEEIPPEHLIRKRYEISYTNNERNGVLCFADSDAKTPKVRSLRVIAQGLATESIQLCLQLSDAASLLVIAKIADCYFSHLAGNV